MIKHVKFLIFFIGLIAFLPLINCASALEYTEPGRVNYYHGNYERALELVFKSRVLILSLDGTENDSFIHFACGIVAGNTKAGYGQKSINRRVILLRESPQIQIPESIMRFEEIIACPPNNDALVIIENELDRHKKWMGGAS